MQVRWSPALLAVSLTVGCSAGASAPQSTASDDATSTTSVDVVAIRAAELRRGFMQEKASDRRKACAYWVTDRTQTEAQQWKLWKDNFQFTDPAAGSDAPTRSEVQDFYLDVCANAPTAEELLESQPGRVDFIGAGIEVLRVTENIDLCERFSSDPTGAAEELYEPSSFDPDITLTHAEAALINECG